MKFLDRIESLRTVFAQGNTTSIDDIDEDNNMIDISSDNVNYKVWIATDNEYENLVKKFDNRDLSSLMIDGSYTPAGFNLVVKSWEY